MQRVLKSGKVSNSLLRNNKANPYSNSASKRSLHARKNSKERIGLPPRSGVTEHKGASLPKVSSNELHILDGYDPSGGQFSRKELLKREYMKMIS